MAIQKSTSARQAARARPERKHPLVKIEEAPASAAAPTGNGEPEKTREQMIAEAAYYRAQRRGFAEGQELEDWLAAEAEIAAAAGEASLATELH